MAYQGINMRATAGYVTDRGDDTYCLGEEYTGSVIRGGLAFGFVGGTGAMLDRSAAVDVECAGICYVANSGATQDFRLDVPAGWTVSGVSVCVGDQGNVQFQNVVIKNGTTVLATRTHPQTPPTVFDATGAARTVTTWFSDSALLSTDLSEGYLLLTIGGDASGTNFSTVTHVGIEYTEAGGSSVVPIFTQHRHRR